MPGIDQVFHYGRASRAYKVVSSAAYNYDRPLVMTECYGGINNMPVANLYKEAMDQFAKGINAMVPHAVWYDPGNDHLPAGPVAGRADLRPAPAGLQPVHRPAAALLQGGRHVADIGVLYPIATLQARFLVRPRQSLSRAASISPRPITWTWANCLPWTVRRDFTFVHPEVLDEKCTVAGAAITLNNKVNAEQYKVFIIPGSRASLEQPEKIKEFYDQGGKVIATTRLPDTSAEFGDDAEVRQLVTAIFGDRRRMPPQCQGWQGLVHSSPEAAALKAVLDEALPDGDVVIEQDLTTSGGNFSYIHKVKDGKSMFFFGNSSDAEVDTWVSLRGKLVPNSGTRMTGKSDRPRSRQWPAERATVTRVHVKIPPVR